MIDPENLKKMNEDEIIACCSIIADWGFNDYEVWEQQSAVYGLLDLYNKTKNQLEEKTYLYNKLETESKYLIKKQQKEIDELKAENQIFQGIKNGTTIIFKAKKKYINEDKINKYYISKYKIREKIKEVLNGVYDAKGILEKLLEE